MSTNDYILNLLNINDKNIKILDGKQEIKKIKCNNYKLLHLSNMYYRYKTRKEIFKR